MALASTKLITNTNQNISMTQSKIEFYETKKIFNSESISKCESKENVHYNKSKKVPKIEIEIGFETPKNRRNNKKLNRRSNSANVKSKKVQKIKPRSSSNHSLLDLWANVRRSERGVEKLKKDQQESYVINSIVNKKEEGLRIIHTELKGRGVENTVFIQKDSFIVEYAGSLISEKKAKEREAEYKKDPTKGSYMFYFKFRDQKWCVDATEESGRLGRLLNHSRTNPNCYLKVIPIHDSPRLCIFAKKDIDVGEELVYDYGDRDKDTIEVNPWLKF